MSDDLTKKRPQDANRINIIQIHELTYWSEKFRCAPEDIIEAVLKVGNSSEDVRKYFDEKLKN